MLHRDEVFVAGGQPSVTYVQRQELHIERELGRAIAIPNHIVSLSGPTKTGKTVLCRRVLGDRQYVWIDGGQIQSINDFWNRIRGELRLASATISLDSVETGVQGGMSIPVVLTATGSRLYRQAKSVTIRMGLLFSIY